MIVISSSCANVEVGSISPEAMTTWYSARTWSCSGVTLKLQERIGLVARLLGVGTGVELFGAARDHALRALVLGGCLAWLQYPLQERACV